MSRNWASTLRLPTSNFPPRPLASARPAYIKKCADELYSWQVSERPANNTFVVHDGPPYANGSLHVGHAMNKVLKDMILRFKVQQGRRVSYVPGWDCHGLPIEMKAIGESGHKVMRPVEIRHAARKLAQSAMAKQLEAFRSYAVMGEWDQRWATMDRDYELRQLELFKHLVVRGLVHRKYKPVYWSPSCRSALAEAELKYEENHTSTCAYVMMPVVEGMLDLGRESTKERLHAIIWTTTPWTIPANKALAVHNDLMYCVVRAEVEGHGRCLFLVGQNRLADVSKACFKDGAYELVGTPVTGKHLTHLKYINKLQGKNAKPQPFIHAEFVTDDSGSGVVHCAPGHGYEDYEVCMRLGIDIQSPVDEDGNLTDDAYPDDPKRLVGQNVLKGASKAVMSILGHDVLHIHKYKHKYPYDWKTKQPVIIRSTEQWFADVESIKKDALDSLKDVQFVPEESKKRLESFVKGRSEWCISRQRAWGVPIPALYRTDGSAIVTDESLAHINSVVKSRGIEAWWTDPLDAAEWIAPSLRGENLCRGTDTMDVWFDSGSSWTMLKEQADVYLEGSDQHRGWFQSSLLSCIAARGMGDSSKAPFKTVITHGFALDQQHKKMSKSQGNIVSPEEIMDGSHVPPLKSKNKGVNAGPRKDALGPDALRLWVAGSEYKRDVTLGKHVLETTHKSLLRYRNIIKMLMGSMHECARTAPVTVVDQMALLQLDSVMVEVGNAYDCFEFYRATGAINNWIANSLSAFYLEASKDRLYCGDGGGVLEPLLMGLLRMLAPITPVLVEEAWDHRPEWLKKDGSTLHPLRQLYHNPLYDATRLPLPMKYVEATMPTIMALKDRVTTALEEARRASRLGSSLQSSVVLSVPAAMNDPATKEGLLRTLRDVYGPEVLESIFVVSDVQVMETAAADSAVEAVERTQAAVATMVESIAVTVEPPRGCKCPRCWRWKAAAEGQLCIRCAQVVGDADAGTHELGMQARL